MQSESSFGPQDSFASKTVVGGNTIVFPATWSYKTDSTEPRSWTPTRLTERHLSVMRPTVQHLDDDDDDDEAGEDGL